MVKWKPFHVEGWFGSLALLAAFFFTLEQFINGQKNNEGHYQLESQFNSEEPFSWNVGHGRFLLPKGN